MNTVQYATFLYCIMFPGKFDSLLSLLYSPSHVHMQDSYSLFSDDLKVIHLAPNYHRPPLSSCSYPILCAKIRPVVFDIEEISMFIGV